MIFRLVFRWRSSSALPPNIPNYGRNASPIASAAARRDPPAVAKSSLLVSPTGTPVLAARAAAAAADATTAATFHVDAAAARVADAAVCAADAYSARVGNSTAILVPPYLDDANFIISGGTSAIARLCNPYGPNANPFLGGWIYCGACKSSLAEKDDWQVWLDS